MTESTEPRRRGRPRKPDALTPAERMRRYRARKKAGLVKPKSVTGYEKTIAELETDRDTWKDRAISAQDRIEALKRKVKELEAALERERTTRPIWTESGGRCQARTGAGKRCQYRAAGVVTTEARGFTYEMHVCTRHHDQHRRGGRLVPAGECLPR